MNPKETKEKNMYESVCSEVPVGRSARAADKDRWTPGWIDR
jgi:hypothetical protein